MFADNEAASHEESRLDGLNSWFSSVSEKRLYVVSITFQVVDGTEKLSSVTAEEGWKHLLKSLHLEVIRELAKIIEGPP